MKDHNALMNEWHWSGRDLTYEAYELLVREYRAVRMPMTIELALWWRILRHAPHEISCVNIGVDDAAHIWLQYDGIYQGDVHQPPDFVAILREGQEIELSPGRIERCGCSDITLKLHPSARPRTITIQRREDADLPVPLCFAFIDGAVDRDVLLADLRLLESAEWNSEAGFVAVDNVLRPEIKEGVEEAIASGHWNQVGYIQAKDNPRGLTVLRPISAYWCSCDFCQRMSVGVKHHASKEIE